MRTSQNIDEQPVSIHNAADVAIYIMKYVYVYYCMYRYGAATTVATRLLYRDDISSPDFNR